MTTSHPLMISGVDEVNEASTEAGLIGGMRTQPPDSAPPLVGAGPRLGHRDMMQCIASLRERTMLHRKASRIAEWSNAWGTPWGKMPKTGANFVLVFAPRDLHFQ
jgi:hypothetical protein